MATDLIRSEDNKIMKLPPQSTEAEEALLGAILTNPVSINRIIEYLDASAFYKPANRQIYSAILSLYKDNLAIDIVTVSEFLRENDKLEAIGGRSYINDLALNVVTTANIEYYAKIIKEKSLKRQIITAGSEIVTMAYDNNTAEEVIDNAEKLIFDIAHQKTDNELQPLKDLVIPAFDNLEYQYNNKNALLGVSTGFYDLDELTSGLQKSDLIIIAARPSMGKTAFVLNIAQHVGIHEKRTVAFFSLEMPKDQLVTRMMCSEAEVDSQRVRTGNMGTSDWSKLTTSMSTFSDAPIYIDDSGSVSVLDIKAKCRRLAMEQDLGLIVIDYLQLMSSSANEDRFQQISSISRGLKTLAKELNVPIIALSQLSRAVEQRNDKRPLLSDLRESGAIEQDADIVMFIYRDEYYRKEESESKGKAEIIIAKHRNGPIGNIELLFQPSITKFKNIQKPNIF